MRQKGFATILIIFLILAGAGILAYFSFFYNSTTKTQTQVTNSPVQTTPLITPTISPTQTPPSVITKCRVYPRANSNIPPGDSIFTDRSEVRCEIDGKESVLIQVTDKVGFDTAKNSIYRFWENNEGYKTLIVDQNGAGSGEGNGKILLLKNGGYELQYCFYYVPEEFSGSYLDPLSNQEMSYIMNSTLKFSSQYCDNFVLRNNINL